MYQFLNVHPKGKEVIKMKMKVEEFTNKLNEWISYYGQSKESLNDFANFTATSYEEYNAMWAIIDEIINK